MGGSNDRDLTIEVMSMMTNPAYIGAMTNRGSHVDTRGCTKRPRGEGACKPKKKAKKQKKNTMAASSADDTSSDDSSVSSSDASETEEDSSTE